MTNKTFNYQDIDWNNINYINLSEVKGICKTVKDYFWDNRKEQMQSELITGKVCNFLITTFETYCPEWFDRIGTHNVIGFVVKPAEGHFTLCFNVVLKDYELEDAAFSYSKISKKARAESDVKEACRNAVKEIKTEFKIRIVMGDAPCQT